MNATIRDVRASYPDSKAKLDRTHGPYGYHVIGPVALRLAPWFINRGFSANAVTGLGYLVLIAGLVFLLLGSTSDWCFIAGGVLLNLVILFDFIDGHVARFKRETSRFGTLLDAMLTWLHHALLPICLGFALTMAIPERLPGVPGLQLPGWIWLGAGVAQMAAHLFSIVVGRKTDLLLEGRSYAHGLSGSRLFSAARVLVETQALWLIPATALGLVGVLHLGYAFFRSVLVIGVVIICFRELARADRIADVDPK